MLTQSQRGDDRSVVRRAASGARCSAALKQKIRHPIDSWANDDHDSADLQSAYLTERRDFRSRAAWSP